MKEIGRKSNKTKIKFSWSVRTAKAVHTYRFSGSAKLKGLAESSRTCEA